jgi:hypothetical protein
VLSGIFVCGLVVGCQGNSQDTELSFDKSKQLAQLNETEYAAFCTWANERLGTAGTVVSCPLSDAPDKSITLTVREHPECVSAERPTCTAAAYADCFAALKGSLCEMKDHSACTALRSCVQNWPRQTFLLTYTPAIVENGPDSKSYGW